MLDTTVTGIEQDESGISAVQTSRGTIKTGQVVIAAGPFTGQLAKIMGVELPLTLLRRHRLAVLSTNRIPADAPFTMDDDTGVYWRPEGNGALLGRAYDDEPEVPKEIVPTDWTFPAMVLDPDSPYSAGRLSTFWRDAPYLLIKSNLNLVAGQYTYTPDHMPLVGPVPSVPGLSVITGFSGHGIMAAPASGRRLALILAGKFTGENRFRPERFEEGMAWEARETVY
jgi:sarcosine oxidase subunit beta